MKRSSIALLAAAWLGLLTGSPAHAQALYTSDDTLNAISQYSAEIGVSEARLLAIVRCETGGTFDPYSVGRQGEMGAVQLHPRGLLPKFYALGYLDPFSPWQSVRFLAQEIHFGRARAWSCA